MLGRQVLDGRDDEPRGGVRLDAAAADGVQLDAAAGEAAQLMEGTMKAGGYYMDLISTTESEVLREWLKPQVTMSGSVSASRDFASPTQRVGVYSIVSDSASLNVPTNAPAAVRPITRTWYTPGGSAGTVVMNPVLGTISPPPAVFPGFPGPVPPRSTSRRSSATPRSR